MNSYKIEKKFCGLARISKVQKKGLIFFSRATIFKKELWTAKDRFRSYSLFLKSTPQFLLMKKVFKAIISKNRELFIEFLTGNIDCTMA